MSPGTHSICSDSQTVSLQQHNRQLQQEVQNAADIASQRGSQPTLKDFAVYTM